MIPSHLSMSFYLFGYYRTSFGHKWWVKYVVFMLSVAILGIWSIIEGDYIWQFPNYSKLDQPWQWSLVIVSFFIGEQISRILGYYHSPFRNRDPKHLKPINYKKKWWLVPILLWSLIIFSGFLLFIKFSIITAKIFGLLFSFICLALIIYRYTLALSNRKRFENEMRLYGLEQGYLSKYDFSNTSHAVPIHLHLYLGNKIFIKHSELVSMIIGLIGSLAVVWIISNYFYALVILIVLIYFTLVFAIVTEFKPNSKGFPGDAFYD